MTLNWLNALLRWGGRQMLRLRGEVPRESGLTRADLSEFPVINSSCQAAPVDIMMEDMRVTALALQNESSADYVRQHRWRVLNEVEACMMVQAITTLLELGGHGGVVTELGPFKYSSGYLWEVYKVCERHQAQCTYHDCPNPE